MAKGTTLTLRRPARAPASLFFSFFLFFSCARPHTPCHPGQQRHPLPGPSPPPPPRRPRASTRSPACPRARRPPGAHRSAPTSSPRIRPRPCGASSSPSLMICWSRCVRGDVARGGRGAFSGARVVRGGKEKRSGSFRCFFFLILFTARVRPLPPMAPLFWAGQGMCGRVGWPGWPARGGEAQPVESVGAPEIVSAPSRSPIFFFVRARPPALSPFSPPPPSLTPPPSRSRSSSPPPPSPLLWPSSTARPPRRAWRRSWSRASSCSSWP